MDEFTIHACEQVLRFTQVEHWNDLPEEFKIQLGFNMGVVALGLKLTKGRWIPSSRGCTRGTNVNASLSEPSKVIDSFS